MAESQFCGKCGELIPTSNNYCSKCGAKKESSAFPKKETKLNKFDFMWSKVQIILGTIVFLGGIYFLNILNILLGIALFGIGFVRWKSKSKTLHQLTDIIGWIMLVVIIINFVGF